MISIKRFIAFLIIPFALSFGIVHADSRSELDRDARVVLSQLIASNESAKKLSEKAIATLVFPVVTKAGFILGGQYGDGVLFKQGRPVAYYNTAGGSYGLQAGAQQFGYVLFFMKESALSALDSTQGFEVGVGPSVVLVDQGAASSTTTITAQDDIYAFITAQKGVMAGLGIQGNKITKLAK
ncbi:lipid-binding SYLF domain-containing protein [Polynucleobacter acidiphobus]|uniref:lipid-binding SYLF domain-containing protein n=1 Tax=Polynucleobacter acidiphobus TaxID=556053 RepID=UPI000D362383|nr:lipid-binding SYLF domain-containing protein [Polynucleobacter acidiphobus]